MMRKRINKVKQLLFVSSISFSSIAAIGIGTSAVDNNLSNNQKLTSTLQNNATTPNLNNNQKINTGLENIASYSSYDPIYSSVSHQVVSTTIGFVGLSKDKKTVILTSYNGLIAWSNNVTQANIVTSYLTSVGVNNANNYTITSWLNVEDKYLAILLGSSDANEPNITFALNLSDGQIYAPKVDNANNPIPSKNIVTVDKSVNTIVGSSQAGSYFAIPMGNATSNDILNKVSLITINNLGVSKLNLQNRKVTKDLTEKILSFTPGPIGSNTNFLMTYDSTNDSFNVYNVTNQFWNVINSDNTTQSYVIDKNLFKLNGLQDTEKTTFFETLTIRQGFFIGNRFANANNFNILIPKCGDTANNSGFLLFNYNNGTATFSDYKSFSGSSGIEQPSMVAVDGNKVFYSTKKSSINTIFGQIDMTTPANPVFTNIKASTSESQRAKPWLFAPVKNSNAQAYVYIDTVTANGTIKREVKTNNNWGNPTDLSFNKYNDPVAAIKANGIYTSKIVNNITDAELISLLTFSATNLTNTYTKSIVNRINDPSNGILEFDYKIETVAWWNSSARITFYIHTKVTGFYSLNKISFSFVTSPTVDNTKYTELARLKTTKYADQVTKQEVLDHFIKYTIYDKNNTQLTIDQSMITLSTNANKDALTVVVQLPIDRFPTGINSFSSLIKRTYTFTGFLSYGGYSFKVNTSASDSLRSKYPSQVTFDDIINEVVTLGYAYSKASSDWTYSSSYDDLNGTLTINELTYTKSITPALPESLTKIIKSPIRINGLMSTTSLFTKVPSIQNIPKSQTVGKTVLDIWNEYKNALDNNDTLSLQRSLIYKSLNNNVTLNKDDLVLKATNLATAEQDGKLEFEATIKANAPLVYKQGNTNIIFDSNYETKIKELYPNTYPFRLTQKIEIEQYEVNWNSSITNGNENITLDSENNVVINLDVASWNGVSNNMTANDFANNFDNYKNNILELFTYTDSYKPVISKPIVNSSDGSVVFEIEFIPTISGLASQNENNKNLTSNNYYSNNAIVSVSKQITIKGFKLYSSTALSVIPIVIIVLIAVSLLTLLIYIFIRTKKIKKLNQSNFQNPIVDGRDKYLGVKQVVVEKSHPLGINKKSVIKNELIDNSKRKKDKKWI